MKRGLPLFFAATVAAVGVFAALGAQAVAVTSVDSISIPVSDVDRAVDFYTRVLTFRKVADREISGDSYEHLFGVFGLKARSARLQLGGEFIELVQVLTPAGRPQPADFHSNDRWFQHIAIIVSDMDKAYARLESERVTHASPTPQTLPDWNPNAGGISAYYFKDPDGNHLEILHFPAGKGAPKWHQSSPGLFLGVDHTAIVVDNTEASLTFYRDSLGMKVAGASENYGPEQERLNNVFGAHLRITALRAASGPGIEFLEYLSPRTGRPYPADSTAADRWGWTMNLRVGGNGAASNATEPFAPDRSWRWVSSYPVTLPDRSLGFGMAFVTRDPDGHAINLEID
jgi:catechol 2,3-dioxygenase-like lactoylglutathione lyase family enzyme